MIRLQYCNYNMDYWIDYSTVMENSDVQYHLNQMKRNYPDSRCRAVDMDGRIIDILS